jgi:DNA-binding transcriptional MerR regulator
MKENKKIKEIMQGLDKLDKNIERHIKLLGEKQDKKNKELNVKMKTLEIRLDALENVLVNKKTITFDELISSAEDSDSSEDSGSENASPPEKKQNSLMGTGSYFG